MSYLVIVREKLRARREAAAAARVHVIKRASITKSVNQSGLVIAANGWGPSETQTNHIGLETRCGDAHDKKSINNHRIVLLGLNALNDEKRGRSI